MSGKRSPLISVIVPAYNEEKYLAFCLKSLISQDFPSSRYEIIVVDNASTDGTVQIAKGFPVRLIREPRQSVVLARQAGYKASLGQIIVSADADTIYPSRWLSLIEDSFLRRPGIVGISGWIYFTGTPAWFNYLIALNQKINLILSRLTGRFPLVFAANFAFRRSAMEQIGGYPVHLPELGDQQYLLSKILTLGPVIIRPEIFCHTSSRRHRGKLGKIIIHNGWYRLIGYTVNRLSGKTLIGPAPSTR